MKRRAMPRSARHFLVQGDLTNYVEARVTSKLDPRPLGHTYFASIIAEELRESRRANNA